MAHLMRGQIHRSCSQNKLIVGLFSREKPYHARRFGTALQQSLNIHCKGQISWTCGVGRNMDHWSLLSRQDVVSAGDLVPKLDWKLHKGCNGKICIIGGSKWYTGAPYFAAMSALRLGADLAYILTVPEAAQPIKCYSPELMVCPTLPSTAFPSVDESDQEFVARLLKKADCLVVGPGLGNDPVTVAEVLRIMSLATQQSLPMVIDADAIRVAESHTNAFLEAISGSPWCVMTPNTHEFGILKKAILSGCLRQLSRKLGGPSILIKGLRDRVLLGSDSDSSKADGFVLNTEEAMPKRSGGQGVLATDIIEMVPDILSQVLSKEELQKFPTDYLQ